MQTEKYSFSIDCEQLNITHFMNRYHFEKKDSMLVEATGRFLAELLLVESGICYLPEKVICAVTLGSKFDQLEEVASDDLLLSYCMECYGMEFLSKAYEKINDYVFENCGRWMGHYHFLDDREIEEELKKLEGLSIFWENGMLHPAKSVLFTAEYTDKREESGCGHCSQCGNVSCLFRKQEENPNNTDKNRHTMELGKSVYSYGISRIFGEKKG
ncbi:MAG: hypothetical protein ACI4A3_01810 [Lachnospiraceae bacterium]